MVDSLQDRWGGADAGAAGEAYSALPRPGEADPTSGKLDRASAMACGTGGAGARTTLTRHGRPGAGRARPDGGESGPCVGVGMRHWGRRCAHDVHPARATMATSIPTGVADEQVARFRPGPAVRPGTGRLPPGTSGRSAGRQ